LLLPHAQGAIGNNAPNGKQTWNQNSLNNTLGHGATSSQKNKERYMPLQ
jgi:predicted phage tail protein